MMKRWLWLLLLMMLMGCATPQPDEPLLFADDFSDPQSGWSVWVGEDAFAAYLDGGLRLFNKRAGYDIWSLTGRMDGDVIISAAATVMGGPLDNRLGLICRYQDPENYYAFLISSDGYAGILRLQAGQLSILSAPTLEYTPLIETGWVTNRIQADCVGERLTLWVNGQVVAEAHDASFSVGDVGVWVGSAQQGGVDVLFDDFLLLRGGG
mgnify:CR=1 FL=1